MGALQFIALGKIASSLLGIEFYLGVVIGGVIIIVYSVYGGIKAVLATDILQFLIIIIVIPLISVILLSKIGGIKAIITSLPKEKFFVFNHKKLDYYLIYALVGCALPGGAITVPAFTQRLLMTSDPKQIRNQYFVFSIIDTTFVLTIAIISMASFVLFPSMNPDNIFPTIIVRSRI